MATQQDLFSSSFRSVIDVAPKGAYALCSVVSYKHQAPNGAEERGTRRGTSPTVRALIWSAPTCRRFFIPHRKRDRSVSVVLCLTSVPLS